MPKLSQIQITLILLAIVAIIGIFLFGFPPKFSKPGTPPQQNQSAAQVLSIAGKVELVNAKDNSFQVANTQDGKKFTVRIGQDTKLVQLVFPFDLKNPPANKTFTPERKSASLSDLKAGDQVFVRASQPIKEGQDVADPIEIQILP